MVRLDSSNPFMYLRMMNSVSAAPRVENFSGTTLTFTFGNCCLTRSETEKSASISSISAIHSVSWGSRSRLSRIQNSIGRPAMLTIGLVIRYPSFANRSPMPPIGMITFMPRARPIPGDGGLVPGPPAAWDEGPGPATSSFSSIRSPPPPSRPGGGPTAPGGRARPPGPPRRPPSALPSSTPFLRGRCRQGSLADPCRLESAVWGHLLRLFLT